MDHVRFPNPCIIIYAIIRHALAFRIRVAPSRLWGVIRAKTTPHIVYDAHHTQNCTDWGPDRCKSGPHTGRMCRSCQNSRRHTDVISKFLYFFYNKTFLFVSRIQQHGHALDLSSRKVFYLLLLHPSMTNKLKEAGGEANV